jgi:GAF domain-containing protein
VGIFLLDASEEYAVLRASNSEGGKQLLASEHKLEVGVQGMVGYVAMSGEPRIALDVGQDAVHFKNPALPETRSEMALPLMVGGKILGVLDVQSTRAGAFTEEDASILQIMADQIAIAIDNAHLLAETNEALENSRRAFGELQQEVWDKVLSGKPDIGYLATREDEQVQEYSHPPQATINNAMQSGEIIRTDLKTVAIPIKLRDLVIGAVRLQKSEHDKDWTLEEIKLMQTIADQLSIALESARLYEDTQRRAERERLAGEITGKIRASNDPNEILQVAARELRQALRASQAQVLIRGSNGEGRTPAIADKQSDPTSNSSPRAS